MSKKISNDKKILSAEAIKQLNEYEIELRMSKFGHHSPEDIESLGQILTFISDNGSKEIDPEYHDQDFNEQTEIDFRKMIIRVAEHVKFNYMSIPEEYLPDVIKLIKDDAFGYSEYFASSKVKAAKVERELFKNVEAIDKFCEFANL